MRIGNIDKITQIYQNQAGQAKRQVPSPKDEIEISNEAQVLGTAFKAVKESQDVRMDRVNFLKEQIQNGTYDVSAKDVSEKILNKLIV
ncbi:flagellar biosynthesis anti-sigma factor FlgM [Candidatus Epulonipiscium viviparus]|uniref:flagellar biosynthesis anti-sigma factor FlgM n=1 Tax=Candidatus Epulonipiscium viviparus TaxID=420336 RepID=UPI00016C0EC9|nr:flagellar biosynthesis anti-sigma factor FlgM [Candidatus Epulopiscium viviparus]